MHDPGSGIIAIVWFRANSCRVLWVLCGCCCIVCVIFIMICHLLVVSHTVQAGCTGLIGMIVTVTKIAGHVCVYTRSYLITPVRACITAQSANSDGVHEVKSVATLRLSLRSIVAAAASLSVRGWPLRFTAQFGRARGVHIVPYEWMHTERFVGHIPYLLHLDPGNYCACTTESRTSTPSTWP